MVCKCKVLSCECCGCFVPQRWLGTFLLFGVICLSFVMRVCTHIAIVRMVKYRNTTGSSKNVECVEQKGFTKAKTKYGDNDWDEDKQSWVLSVFYMTYVILHFPAGFITDKFGARWVVTTGFLISAIMTLLYPVCTDHIGFGSVLVLRLIQGGAQGVLFPASGSYLGRWVPKHERALTGAISFSGISLGPILGTLLTGFMMEGMDEWRFIFYFWGITCLIFYIILMMYMYSEPVEHPHITERELTYIQTYVPPKQVKKPPYKKIWSDCAIWASVWGQMGHSGMIFLISTNMPKYLDNVLRFSVSGNGLFSSLPYLGMFISGLISGWVADWGIKKKKWDLGLTRKVYTLIANIPPAACLVIVGYIGCRQYLAVALFAIAMFLKGLFFAGLKVNTMDLTQQYSGTAMAMSNGLGAIIGFIVPKVIAWLAPDNTFEQWQWVFWVVFIICTTFTLLYTFLGSGKKRRWDYEESDQQYFTGKPKVCSIKDGVDKDKEAVTAGRAAAAGTPVAVM